MIGVPLYNHADDLRETLESLLAQSYRGFRLVCVDDWRIRFRQTMRHMSAGNMVYGLGRVDVLRRAGVYRRVLVPDRLLLMELALEGQFRQAPALLWFRRLHGQTFSLERQHRAFFPNGRPLYAYVPWWISHAAVLTWMLGVCGQRTPAISRWAEFQLGGSYLWKAGLLYSRQELTSIRPASKRRHKFRPDLILWRYYKTNREAFRNWRTR